MQPDKFQATWVSFSSISDFLNCPRAYYLKNVYKDPKTGNKIKLMSPALALGQAVHSVIEALSILPVEKRFQKSLIKSFDEVWEGLSGKNGGFYSDSLEKLYKDRGKKMIQRVTKNPGPLKKKAVKIQMDLPWFWLSEESEIILCGKLDWIEYLEETDSVHIIDFKTGKSEENSESLQLPIYHLLADKCQKRKVEKASYWYLERKNFLTELELPDLRESQEKILKIAKKIKLARKLEDFDCVEDNGCKYCKSFEKILAGEAEFIGTDNFKRDTYVIEYKKEVDVPDEEVIL